jgi:hypothetical protein
MNKFIHSKIIEETKNITEKTHQEYELFYKPHPVEFIDFKEEFSEDFGELKNIPYIKVIKDEQLFQSVVKSSDFNIGIISSIMYYPLVLNKKTIIFNTEDIGVEKGFDIESYKGKMYNFWAPIVKVNSFEEFIKLVDLNFIENTIKRKNYMMNIIKENLTQYDGNFKWLTLNKNINHDKILQLFDNFNDFKASERIVNEIENLYA